jgi:glycosyltransferase involved in cell wall biosynthesis
MSEGAPLRVLITVPSLAREHGGLPQVAEGLSVHLRKRGANVRVMGAAADPAGRGEGLSQIGRFHGTPVPAAIRPLVNAARTADVVHVLGYRDPVGALAVFSSAGRAPVVLEPSGMARPRIRSLRMKRAFDRTLGRRLMGAAAVVVATSELERRELETDGVDPAKVRVRPVGLPISPPHPDRSVVGLRTRFGMQISTPLVIHIGRMTAKKGLPDLIRAVASIEALHLVLAGPVDRDGTIKRLLELRRLLRVEDRVHVLPGGLWGAEKQQALRDADCFALPSQTENFGIAVAEAAAEGLPVVISDQCGVMEFLSPEAMIVVRAGDPKAISNALDRATTDPRMREAALSSVPEVVQTLGWGELAERQLEIYREAIVERPVSRSTQSRLGPDQTEQGRR